LVHRDREGVTPVRTIEREPRAKRHLRRSRCCLRLLPNLRDRDGEVGTKEKKVFVPKRRGSREPSGRPAVSATSAHGTEALINAATIVRNMSRAQLPPPNSTAAAGNPPSRASVPRKYRPPSPAMTGRFHRVSPDAAF
jgi:hypothetical protein